MASRASVVLPFVLLACRGNVTNKADDSEPAASQLHRSGRLIYETTWERDAAGPADPDGARARALQQNTTSPRVVYFNGSSARAEETNADYGFRSACIKLWRAGQPTLYCKALPYLRFCMPLPPLSEPIGSGATPIVTPSEETRTVAALDGRKAHYARGTQQLDIVYAPRILVDDPTGAVDRLDGVPGFLLEQLAPPAPGLGYARRTSLTLASFEAQPPDLFTPPDGFRMFDGIDAARAEDRRLGEAAARDELAQRPLVAGEAQRYISRWQRVGVASDSIEVSANGADFTVRLKEAGSARELRATLLGRRLRVDESPNYRLYDLEPDGRHLVLFGDLGARYERVAP